MAPVPGPRTPKERRRATREVASVWLADHIGRLAGAFLGFLAFLGLAFLAIIGYHPALAVLIVVVIGIALIALGGRFRGGR